MAAENLHHEDEEPISTAPPKAHKGEEGEGPWLVSYADLMTLLMGFFALMLSFSKFDDSEFEKMKEQNAKLFGGDYRKPYEDLKNKIQLVIDAKGLSDQVSVESNTRGVGITFRGTVFFDVGLVSPRSEAISLLEEISPVLKEEAPGFYILVEGHTDDTPISQGVIASNWELSALRASGIVRFFERENFDRARLMAVGWSDTKPSVSNRDKDGVPDIESQSANRRVVIHILKSSPIE